MTALYTFGRCKTPYGHIDLESYMGPEYAHATFYRTDGSEEPLTMAQPGEYSFDDRELDNETYGLNEVPCDRIFVALMTLQAELFQQKYERL